MDTCKDMIEFIKTYKVDCDLSLSEALNVAVSEEEAKYMKEYYQTLVDLGLNEDNNMSYYSEKEAQEFSKSKIAKGGMHFKFAGQVWPAKFVCGIADVCIELGTNIQTHTTVSKVVRDLSKDLYLVHTDRGIISARHVVYATNGYSSGLIPEIKNIIRPTRGQVLVTSPLKLRLKGNMWFDYGYQYILQREDGRVVLGGSRLEGDDGEEGNFNDSTIHPRISKSLKDFMLRSWPELKEEPWWVEYEWTGVMGFTPDEQPLIGNLRGREWIAAGYTGYGMPKCFGAGKAIAGMIANTLSADDFVPQFSPSRYYPISKI